MTQLPTSNDSTAKIPLEASHLLLSGRTLIVATTKQAALRCAVLAD